MSVQTNHCMTEYRQTFGERILDIEERNCGKTTFEPFSLNMV